MKTEEGEWGSGSINGWRGHTNIVCTALRERGEVEGSQGKALPSPPWDGWSCSWSKVRHGTSSLCWKKPRNKQDCVSRHHLDAIVQGCYHISALTKCSFPNPWRSCTSPESVSHRLLSAYPTIQASSFITELWFSAGIIGFRNETTSSRLLFC